MDPNSVSSIFDDPHSLLIAGLTLGIILMLFLDHLWLSLFTEFIVGKNVSCTENGVSATVDFLTQVADSGLSYRDVVRCSLQSGGQGIACRKGCLSSRPVRVAPLLSFEMRKKGACGGVRGYLGTNQPRGSNFRSGSGV